MIAIGALQIECEITVAASEDDGTHFAGDYVNPFIESAAHVARGIKNMQEKYKKEATCRRLPALREALEEVIKSGTEPEATRLVGTVLLELTMPTDVDSPPMRKGKRQVA